MSLELRSIVGKGEISKERLTLRALTSCDVGDFIVLRTGHDGEDVTTDARNAFWFPYQNVESGDLVVVYTKRGNRNFRSLTTGKTAHFFYLGLNETIWHVPKVAAVLLYAPTWQARPASEL
jgi:hypothetical protein